MSLNQTYPRPLPWHLRPWRLSGVLTPTRTRGEVGFNLNGSFVDIWIRIAGRERWFAVDALDLQQSLRAVGTFSLAAESDGNAEVSEV